MCHIISHWQISDLLKPERSNLNIREDKKRGVFVDGLSEWVVRSPAEIYGLMERGGMVRATGETKMNEFSSRSHAVFIVIAEQSETVYVDDKGDEVLHHHHHHHLQHYYHHHCHRHLHYFVRCLRKNFKSSCMHVVYIVSRRWLSWRIMSASHSR